MTGEQSTQWDYDPSASTYEVNWFFNILDDSNVEYLNLTSGSSGEFRRSDECLHHDEASTDSFAPCETHIIY